MIASRENSSRRNPSPEAIIVYRGSSNSRRQAPRASQCAIAELRRMAFLLALCPALWSTRRVGEGPTA